MANGGPSTRKITNVQANVIHICQTIRETEGFSQEDVGRMAGISTYPRQTINKFEHGRWLDAPLIEDVIAAYARISDQYRDAGAIWRAAVDHWREPLPGSRKALADEFVKEAGRRIRQRRRARSE